jgi:aspartyl protease family protein
MHAKSTHQPRRVSAAFAETMMGWPPSLGLASMRQILVMVGLLIGFGALVARFADNAVMMRPSAAVATSTAPQPAPAAASNYRTLEVRADRRGHFRVDGRVDGSPMSFMVDTGATAIALRARDAAMLGIHPAESQYTAKVSTANGTIRAAPVELSMVEVGGLTVRDVRALVMPEGVLSENLLGLSFLRRLRRFEYSNGKLVLEQ